MKSLDEVATRVITGTSSWTVLFFLHCWLASASGGAGVIEYLLNKWDKVLHNQHQLYTLYSLYHRGLCLCSCCFVKSTWSWSRWTDESVRINHFDLLVWWSMGPVNKINVNSFFECMSTSTADIGISTVDRFFFVWIDLYRWYQPIFGYRGSNKP